MYMSYTVAAALSTGDSGTVTLSPNLTRCRGTSFTDAGYAATATPAAP